MLNESTKSIMTVYLFDQYGSSYTKTPQGAYRPGKPGKPGKFREFVHSGKVRENSGNFLMT